MRTEVFRVVRHVNLQTSYGVIAEQEDVELEVTVGIKDDEYGWFEFYDTETGGEKWCAEGGIWIENGQVKDYDGVFELSDFVIDKLNEMGIKTDEI